MNNTNTISKILTGINNTLNIANKALPIVKEAKPLLNKASAAYKTIKNNKDNLSNITKLINIKKQLNKDLNNNNIQNKKEYLNQNNPTFFI